MSAGITAYDIIRKNFTNRNENCNKPVIIPIPDKETFNHFKMRRWEFIQMVNKNGCIDESGEAGYVSVKLPYGYTMKTDGVHRYIQDDDGVLHAYIYDGNNKKYITKVNVE